VAAPSATQAAALIALVVAIVAYATIAAAEEPAMDHARHAHEGHAMEGMEMSAAGMVMNQNTDHLPKDCTEISQDVPIVVHAGRKYAAAFPGTTYAYDAHEWDVPPCARVTVTLVNDDRVRHQWMVHGLPRYLYPEGMFHLEVNGQAQVKGTFIVPSAAKTYLVHCDVPQHAEKGMKAELKVAGGDGDLPSIPGVSAPIEEDSYRVRWDVPSAALAAGGALAGMLLALVLLLR
jgi:FtsP/CotA-like multicopper oxidase with cupredoxin domain